MFRPKKRPRRAITLNVDYDALRKVADIEGRHLGVVLDDMIANYIGSMHQPEVRMDYVLEYIKESIVWLDLQADINGLGKKEMEYRIAFQRMMDIARMAVENNK